jgi:hypothetical protein
MTQSPRSCFHEIWYPSPPPDEAGPPVSSAARSTRERVRQKKVPIRTSRKSGGGAPAKFPFVCAFVCKKWGGGVPPTCGHHRIVCFVRRKRGGGAALPPPRHTMLCPATRCAFELRIPLRSARAGKRRGSGNRRRDGLAIRNNGARHARKCKAASPLGNGFIFAPISHADFPHLFAREVGNAAEREGYGRARHAHNVRPIPRW